MNSWGAYTHIRIRKFSRSLSASENSSFSRDELSRKNIDEALLGRALSYASIHCVYKWALAGAFIREKPLVPVLLRAGKSPDNRNREENSAAFPDACLPTRFWDFLRSHFALKRNGLFAKEIDAGSSIKGKRLFRVGGRLSKKKNMLSK